jgi:hypothetical protein
MVTEEKQLHKNRRYTTRSARALAAIFTSLVLLSSTYGTSLVAKLDLQRIIIATDGRRDSVEEGQAATRHHYKDDSCKLSAFGSTAVAVAGNRSYIRHVATDAVPNWDALDDAKAAQLAHGYDVHAVAMDWATRAAREYTVFYQINPRRVIQMAEVNAQHVLVDAFVVGWQDGIPVLYWEKVSLEVSNTHPIRQTEQLLGLRALPYTTNPETQSLIEGNRATENGKLWKEQSLHFPQSERDWRWLEFLIASTHDYDDSVGKDVNVVEVPVSGQARWLQNRTCH